MDNEKVQLEIVYLRELYKNGGNINLVCWCAPKACHGYVLKDVIESL